MVCCFVLFTIRPTEYLISFCHVQVVFRFFLSFADFIESKQKNRQNLNSKLLLKVLITFDFVICCRSASEWSSMAAIIIFFSVFNKMFSHVLRICCEFDWKEDQESVRRNNYGEMIVQFHCQQITYDITKILLTIEWGCKIKFIIQTNDFKSDNLIIHILVTKQCP